MTRYAPIGVGIVAALVAIVVLGGYLLPVRHQATRSVLLQAAPDSVYRLLADVDAYPTWRRGLTAVERVRSDDGALRYREVGSDAPILYAVVADEAPRRRITRIADASMPFGGQ